MQAILRQYSEDEIVVNTDGGQDGVERFGVRNTLLGVGKHSRLAEYRDALGRERFDHFYKFSCVRNPWDRMISLYFSPHRGRDRWNPRQFERLVESAQSAADILRLDPGDRDPFGNVDSVIRYEQLNEDFRAVAERMGIEAPELPVYNRSSREHYSQYYDARSRDLVARRHAEDIARFSYTFD